MYIKDAIVMRLLILEFISQTIHGEQSKKDEHDVHPEEVTVVASSPAKLAAASP
jgi:hypothetical protein